jgi:hypothetical protein
MMRKRPFLSFAYMIAIMSVLTSATAAQEICTCDGDLLPPSFSGGDSAPLVWKYAPYMQSLGSGKDEKLICYLKVVSNHGNSDVRSVRWEVANFFRRIIPNKQARSTCPSVAGETKPAPTNGKLYFGVSSNGYDTTIVEPKHGWGDTADNSNLAPLHNTITFDVEDGDKTSFAKVTLESSVKRADKGVYLNYGAHNDSDAQVFIQVNLPVTKAMIEKVPLFTGLWMRPQDHQQFEVFVEGQPLSQSALVVLSDSSKRMTAIDSGGFYTVAGAEKLRSDRNIWELTK